MMPFLRIGRKTSTYRNWKKDFFKKENTRLTSGTTTFNNCDNYIIYMYLVHNEGYVYVKPATPRNILFLSKTLNFSSAPLQPGIQMGTGELLGKHDEMLRG